MWERRKIPPWSLVQIISYKPRHLETWELTVDSAKSAPRNTSKDLQTHKKMAFICISKYFIDVIMRKNISASLISRTNNQS